MFYVVFCIAYFMVTGSSVGGEVGHSAIDFLQFCGFCSDGFPLPLGAKERMCTSIVALPGPSI